jgi:hypothetical protein
MKTNKSLVGSKIAGGNPENERVENDFYATNPKAVEMLLNAHKSLKLGLSFLEPCVGTGNIIEVAKRELKYCNKFTGIDLIDRSYPDTIVTDFLTWETDKQYDIIISNPPYSLAQEFIEKGLSLLTEYGQMAMFLKIQFLEGDKRKEFYKKYPPKYIYVFSKRMATWNNNNPINPETGKKWVTTFCFAWYVWEKDFKGEPIVRWL